MALVEVELALTGTTALLMHSDILTDPLSEEAKAFKKISSKRTKTEADHEEMARLEFHAGLYVGPDGTPAVPNPNVIKCLIEGARITKSGPKIERGIQGANTHYPLQYEGPVTPEELYADKRFVSRMPVRVGTGRLIRTRPRFYRWGVIVQLVTDDTVVSVEDLSGIALNAGSMVGLMDYRKPGGFGRFRAEASAA